MSDMSVKHQFWLRQLRLEFENVCFQYGVRLALPAFEITLNERECGAWFPSYRTMRISQHLIEQHSWDVTVNVLKHEMAHQYCSEVMGLDRAGHGPEYQQACDALGVPPVFRTSSGDLPAGVTLAAGGDIRTEEGRRVIERVKKLLALAGSSNENEAAVAMQKAHDLMAAHNLSQLELDQRAGYTYTIIETGKKRLATYKRAIGSILRDYFHVDVVYSSLYDPRRNEEYKTIELLGREENVAIAEHCHHFLENRLDALWKQNGHQYGGNRITARNSYYLGLLEGFRGKLAAQEARYWAKNNSQGRNGARPPSGLKDLIVAEDHRLTEFVGQRFPKLRTFKSRGPRIHADTYRDAVDEGRKLVLHRVVTEEGGDSGRLLDHNS